MAPRIDWDSHIEAWQGSGLSQAAFCRLHRLGLSSFSAKVRARRVAPAGPLPIAPGLVPVRVGPANDAESPSIAQARAGDVLVLRMVSGHVLELPASAGPGWVAELLRCLG